MPVHSCATDLPSLRAISWSRSKVVEPESWCPVELREVSGAVEVTEPLPLEDSGAEDPLDPVPPDVVEVLESGIR